MASCRRQRRRQRALILGIFLLLQVNALSASMSADSPHRPRRRKRKRRSRRPVEESSLDLSSASSPTFLPLVFSDDEQEEHILSALARTETEEDEEEDQQQPEAVIRHVRKKKRPVKSEPSEAQQKESKQSDDGVDEEKDVKEPQQPVQSVGKEASVLNQNGVKESSIQSSSVTAKTPPTPVSFVAPERTIPSTAFRATTPMETSVNRSPPQPVQNVSQQTVERQSYNTRPASSWSSPPLQRQNPAATGTTRTSAAFSGTQPAHHYPNAHTSPRPAVHSSPSTTLWVQKFLSSRPRDTLLPVPREYLSDGFNLVQLAPIVEASMGGSVAQQQSTGSSSSSSHYPLFKAALRVILDQEPPSSPAIQRAAEVLYTLVHARYVISPRGLDTVRRVLRRSDGTVEPVFGRCPRISCRGMPLLPYGDSEHYQNSVISRAKRYCPCCGEKLYMWDSKVDESAWGPTFCHLFLMTYGSTVFPELCNSRGGSNSTKEPSARVEPSIFGFKLHPSSQLRYTTTQASS